MNILKYYEESEECVNDTYFAAWEQIPPDRPQKLLPYLGRITRCLALNRYDYLTAQKRNVEFTLQLSELEECLTGTDSIETQYESGEVASSISSFLKMQNPVFAIFLSGVIGFLIVSQKLPIVLI